MKHKTYYPNISKVRFICMVLIVMIHTNPFIETWPLLNNILIKGLSRIAVPFYFASTGFLIYRSNCLQNKPAFKKYIYGLIKYYLIWFLIYLPIGFIQLQTYADKTSSIELGHFLSYLINAFKILFLFGSSYHLWYLPALIISLLLVRYFVVKRKIKWLVILSSFLFLLGASETYYGLINGQVFNNSLTWYFSHFITTRNALFFPMIFLIMGIRVAMKDIKWSTKHMTIMLTFSLMIMILEITVVSLGDFSKDYNFMFYTLPGTFVILTLASHKSTRTFSYLGQALKMHTRAIYNLHVGIITLLPLWGLSQPIMLFFLGLMIPISSSSMIYLYKLDNKHTYQLKGAS